MTERPPPSAPNKRPGRSDRESRRLAPSVRPLQRNEPAAPSRGGDWQTQDLFAWGARQKKFQESGSISVRRTLPSPSAARGGRHARRGNVRLGETLYSGSFGRLTPARKDAAVQRNRILFGVLVLCLTLYVIVNIVGG